jgi:uncharacterized protein (DUF1330 family)
MPRGYFLGEFEITDPAIYEAYRTKVPDIISDHGGRILVRGGEAQSFDGSVPRRHFVIVEFDSPEAARTFYYSDAYQAVLPLRLNASTRNGFGCLLTGVDQVISFSPMRQHLRHSDTGGEVQPDSDGPDGAIHAS